MRTTMKTMKGSPKEIEMPSAPKPRAIEVDAPSAASIEVGLASTLAVDEFYNATGKAPHLDAIVPKQDSG